MTAGEPVTADDRARAAAALASRPVEEPPAPRCAPLRQGPRWELLLRVVLAVLVVAVPTYRIVAAARGTRFIQGGEIYGTLRNHIAQGRVTTIDDTDGQHVQWRLRDGSVYAENHYRELDLRATVAAQPYVRAHPGAIRYAEIGKRIENPYRPDGPLEDAEHAVQALIGVLVLLAIVTGPEPRHLTRWGWLWASLTGVGLSAYLLLAGSRRRTEDAARPRIAAWWAFAVTVPVVVLIVYAVPWGRTPPANETPGPATAGPVFARA